MCIIKGCTVQRGSTVVRVLWEIFYWILVPLSDNALGSFTGPLLLTLEGRPEKGMMELVL